MVHKVHLEIKKVKKNTTPQDADIEKDIPNNFPLALDMSSTTDKLNLIKLKNDYIVKEKTNHIKKKPNTQNENALFGSNTSGKELISSLFKEFTNQRSKEMDGPLQKWDWDLNCSQKRTEKYLRIISKKCSVSLTIREMQIKQL